MKILMLCDNYPPEMNANARIFSELAYCWSQQNNVVSIITSHPNFPQGIIFEGYKNKWVDYRTENGIEVIRVKTYMYPNRGFFRRSIDFLSFGMSSFIFGSLQKKQDIIVGISPQFFCALSACLIASLKRKPFVFMLCDLWPDAILETKCIKNRFLFKMLKKLELFMYKKASLIATFSPYYNNYLKSNGIDQKKIVTSISGVSKQFYPRPKNTNIIAQYQLQDRFVVAYIGTFGIAHNHGDILKIANYLSKLKDNKIHFLMVGDGAYKEHLKERCTKNNYMNVTIDGPYAGEIIPEYWSVADVALIILSNIKTNKTVIPSKMLEAMAMGKAIVLYAPEGEAKKFLEQANGGIYVQSGCIDELQNVLINLATKPAQLKKWGEKAYLFAKNYTRENQADELLKKIQSLI